jgi:hypothetical protein
LARPRLAREHDREPVSPAYPRPLKMHRSSTSKWGAAMMTMLDMALPVIA